MCLNCDRPKCTNCLGDNHHARRRQVIVQIDPITEEVIATFPTTTEAARTTGTNQSSIAHTIRGLQKTAGGYIWKRTTKTRR